MTVFIFIVHYFEGNFTDLDSITREIEHFRDQEMYYDMNHNMHEYIDPDYGDTIPQADNELVNIVPISCEPMPGTLYFTLTPTDIYHHL